MATKYRAGIIGLGFMGGADQVSGDAIGGQQVAALDGTHIDALSKDDRVEVVAGSSRDEGRRARFTERTGIKTYDNWQAMIEAERFDIVSVATYANVHRSMTEFAVAHGAKAVYVEKPIAQTLADAEAMAKACRDAGALLAVNHNRRYNPNYQRLRDHVASGGLGEITSVSLRWGNGRLGNVGTHLIDAAVMTCGQRVTAVSATLDLAGKPDCRGDAFADPGGWGVLRLEGGAMMTVDAGDYATGKPHVILNGTTGRAITAGDDVTIEMWSGETEHWPSLRSEATSMDRAVKHIVDWLEAGDAAAPFVHTPQESIDVLEVIAAFHASHQRQAAWVELPLKGADRDILINSG